MTPSEADFWREGLPRRPKETPCPRLVWVSLAMANKRYSPWEYELIEKGEWIRHLLRIVARSPSIFPSQNPDLKDALKALHLEWLAPRQISRIRECAAPRRKFPRDRFDRQFGYIGVDPASPKPSPKCKLLFWAWRHDQKTCDAHWWATSMLRVEKHKKAKKARKRNALQLKDARKASNRARRKRRIEKGQAEKLAQAAPLSASQIQAQNDRADLPILKWIRLGFEVEGKDSERLETMIRDGFVVPDLEEPNTYKITGRGLLYLKELRKRVGRGPGTI